MIVPSGLEAVTLCEPSGILSSVRSTLIPREGGNEGIGGRAVTFEPGIGGRAVPDGPGLLGLGFTSLSVSLPAFKRIRKMIRRVSFSELRDLARQLLRMQKPKDVEGKMRATVGEDPS